MNAIELITVQATAPGAGAPWAAVAGNSVVVRDTAKPVWLGPLWQRRQAAGFLRLTSPLLHDSTVGIQLQAGVGLELSLQMSLQRLYAQDSLTVFGSGSIVAGDIEQASYIVAYEELPGAAPMFIDRAELNRKAESLYSFPNTLSLGTIGGYSGAEAVNAEADQLKANRRYAIVGYNTSVQCTSIRYVSSDWANLGVGGPGGTLIAATRFQTANWFVELSDMLAMKCIPVFSSSNKLLTFVDGAQDENGADAVVTTLCCLLKP